MGRACRAAGLHDQAQIGASVLGLAPQQPLNGDDRFADELQHFTDRPEETDGLVAQIGEERHPPLRLAGIFLFRYCRGQFQQSLRPLGQSVAIQTDLSLGAEFTQVHQEGQQSAVPISQLAGIEDQVANPRPAFEPCLNFIGPRQFSAQLPVPGKNHLQRVS